MTREEKVAVVESYLHGLGNADFSGVPFAEDVTYESPLTARKTGKEAVDFLSGWFPIMRGAAVQQHIVEGEYVATVFKLRTPNGETMIFDKVRVVDGKLKKINPSYGSERAQGSGVTSIGVRLTRAGADALDSAPLSSGR